MYNFDLEKNEKVIDNFDDVYVKSGNEVLNVSVIITNLRLLILDFPKNIDPFKFGRMTYTPVSKEIILEVYLSNIKSIKKVNDYYKYILGDDNYFLLSDENTYNIINKKISK